MHKKKIMKIIGAIVIVAIVIVGGYKVILHKKDSKIPKNALVVSLTQMPKEINPIYAKDTNSQILDNILFEPLYRVNKDGSINYDGLAENITKSENGLVYTVKLKNGLKWSNDESITANDIIFTFNQMMKNNGLLKEKFIINNEPVNIEKVNDGEVRFILTTPSSSFEENLGKLRIVPKNSNINQLNKDIVSNGPYVIEKIESNQILLGINSKFNGEKENIDSMVLKVFKTKDDLDNAIRSGEISIIEGTPTLIGEESTGNNYNVAELNSGVVNGIVFNIKNSNMDNLKVRESISYALNREELTNVSGQNSSYAKPAYSVFSPKTRAYTSDVKEYNYNLEKAKKSIEESGVGNITLNLIYEGNSNDTQNEAILVKNSLAKIGINVQLKPMTKKKMEKEITTDSKDYDMAIVSYNIGDNPGDYEKLFVSNGLLNSDSTQEINDLFLAADKANTEAEKSQIYADIQKKFAEEVGMYPINYPDNLILVSNKLDGIQKAGVNLETLVNNWEDISLVKEKTVTS